MTLALLYTHPETGGLVRRTWQLEVLSGSDKGKTATIESTPTLIGAAPAAALVLTDDTVSRYHLEIDVFANGLRLRDLDSTNGTFVLEEPVKDAFVEADEVFILGRTEILVTAKDELAASEVRTDPSSVPPGGVEALKDAIAVSEPMRVLFQRVRQVADSSSAVLLFGEPGTGKAECARIIHDLSARRERPLVRVRFDASMTAEDSDRILFGVAEKRGNDGRMGAFERAAAGTLLLEGIQHVPKETVPKLIRAIERGETSRVGSERKKRADVRMIATAGPDAKTALEPSLLRRVGVVRFELPPLRKRAEDIVPLARLFLSDSGSKQRPGERLSAVLLSERWDGNADQLRDGMRWMLFPDDKRTPLRERLRRALIEDSLAETAGDVTEAAGALGMPDRALWDFLVSNDVDLDALER